MAQVAAVAAAIREALAELCLSQGSEVHYVQVKGPLVTPAGIKDAAQRGAQVVTADPNRSKSHARGATALGVALGLGELAEHQVTNH